MYKPPTGLWEACVSRRIEAVLLAGVDYGGAAFLCFDDGTHFEIYGREFQGVKNLRYGSLRQLLELELAPDTPHRIVAEGHPPLDPNDVQGPCFIRYPDPGIVAPPEELPDLHIQVHGAELARVLAGLRERSGGTKESWAFLQASGDELLIECGEAVGALSFEGEWVGWVGVPLEALLDLVPFIPREPLLPITVTTHIEIGALSLACYRYRNPAPPAGPDRAPRAAPDAELLQLLALARPPRGRRLGLDGAIAGAERRRDDLVRAASRVLEPLGVEEGEVRRLVEERVGRVVAW